MTINTEELRLVLKEIKASPETWNQRSWARRNKCGTSYCFAGHTVVRAGYKIDWGNDQSYADLCIDPETGRHDTIIFTAQRILGIDDIDGFQLFACSNTLEDLEGIVNELCEKAEADNGY